MHCNNFLHQPTNRRDMLRWCANGFGAVALSALSAEGQSSTLNNPLAPKPTHFPPKAKSVIFLYMDGAPSQVDTFDYKPGMKGMDGKFLRNLRFSKKGNKAKKSKKE